jgi:hypothetical protein
MTVESRSIGRVRTTYRLSEAQLGARARLDALVAGALDTALDDALGRAGVSPGEELCVRTVTARPRLRLASTDGTIVAEWSTALADAIAATIRAGEPGAVRYPSRRHALVDVAVATASGDMRRAWAWRQLGLWPDDRAVESAEAAVRVADALCADPQAVVAVLVATARRGALPRLAVLLGSDGWQRLARTALAAVDAPSSLLDEPWPDEPRGEAEARGDDVWVPIRHQEHAERAARRAFTTSSLAVAAVGSGAALGLAPAARRALAVLAALEADPAVLQTDEAPTVVESIARALDVQPGAVPPQRRETPAPGVRVADTAAGAADPAAPADVRTRAWTGAGGLLFLSPFVGGLEPLPGRGFRWTLHRLALVLLPAMDEADPAALAFVGLGPDERAPSDDEPPPSPVELASLASVAATIEAQLAELLEREAGPGLVASVCTRRAEIVAEPGWIDVHLDTAELDVAVRRAGLDLDPGWLPRLGVVVRFVYA